MNKTELLTKTSVAPEIKEITPNEVFCIPETLHLLLKHPISKQKIIDAIKDKFELNEMIDSESKDVILYIKKEK
jgi:hypothetical protein